jgi:glycosyltransferase involved in cell wall biosynthesis
MESVLNYLYGTDHKGRRPRKWTGRLTRRLLKPGGLNLIGYFEHSTGVAQAARDFAFKLRECEVPFSIYPLVSKEAKFFPLDQPMAKHFSQRLPYRINLWILGAHGIIPHQNKTPALFSHRYNIVVPFWEYESGLESDLAAWDKVDEVLALTGFIADNIEKMAPGKFNLSRSPYPYRKDWNVLASAEQTRQRLGLGTRDLLFIFSYDYFSGFQRKNPLGVVSAFTGLAGKTDAKLILKTSNHEAYPDHRQRLRDHIREAGVDRQVRLIEEVLPRDEVMALMACVDCYVSLHRGEGLGLGMFEAMALGKPVIASRYGGAMDFLDDTNSLLVDCSIQRCQEDHYAYKSVIEWAEPDLEQAREFMIKLHRDRDLAGRLGQQAQRTADQLLQNSDFNTSARKLIFRPQNAIS